MAVTLQSATRTSPPPCNHFSVVVDADGRDLDPVLIAAAELDEPITDEEIRAVLRVWGKRQRNRGKTLAQMVGATILADIP